MRIALGSDHAGFQYKQMVAAYLQRHGHDVVDFGTTSEAPVDYPDFVGPAARAVTSGACDGGIVFGGSGNGEAMAANRVRGVRCAVVWNTESARLARAHNDANMLSIGQRLLSAELVLAIVDIWLTTEFDGGRHQVRIEKLDRTSP
jgi:ribose 5-phosphate isomerase B